LIDFKGSFEKIEKTISSGTWLLTFWFVGAIVFFFLRSKWKELEGCDVRGRLLWKNQMQKINAVKGLYLYLGYCVLL